jgi:hypothetical protein
VTTAGAAYALRKSQAVTVGRRVPVGGSGPLLLPVAASLAQERAVIARLDRDWRPLPGSRYVVERKPRERCRIGAGVFVAGVRGCP